jgi:hypothetical protein
VGLINTGGETSFVLGSDCIYVWDDSQGQTLDFSGVSFKHRDPTNWRNEEGTGAAVPAFSTDFTASFHKNNGGGYVSFYLPRIPERTGFNKRYKHEPYVWWRDWNGSSWESIIWYDSVGASKNHNYETYYDDNQYIDYYYNFDNLIRVFFTVEYVAIPAPTPAPPPPTSSGPVYYTLEWILNGGVIGGTYSQNGNYPEGTKIVWPVKQDVTYSTAGYAIQGVYIDNDSTRATGATEGTYYIDFGNDEWIYSNTKIYITWENFNFFWKFNGGIPQGTRAYLQDGLWGPSTGFSWPENVIKNGTKLTSIQQFWRDWRGDEKLWEVPLEVFRNNEDEVSTWETKRLQIWYMEYKEIRFNWTSVRMQFYKKNKTSLMTYYSEIDNGKFTEPPLSSITVVRGWKFDGWYETSALTTERNFENIYTSIYDDIASYSKYIQVKVKLYTNYGVNSYYERTLTTNGYISDIPTVSRSRYRFVSWNIESNSDGSTGTNIYSNTRIQQLNSHPDNAEYTFYAIWDKITMTFYDMDDDQIGDPVDIDLITGLFDIPSDIDIPDSKGKTYNNTWYSTIERSPGTERDLTIASSDTQNLNSYAGFTLIVFTLTFNANISVDSKLDVTNSIANIHYYMDTISVSYDFEFNRQGYNQIGWFIDFEDSQINDLNTETTSELYFVPNPSYLSSATAYAQWELTEYKITYLPYPADSIDSDIIPATNTEIIYTLEPTIPTAPVDQVEYDSSIGNFTIKLKTGDSDKYTKPGYNQIGWRVDYGDGGGIPDQYVLFQFNLNRFENKYVDVNVYPIWEKQQGTITFNQSVFSGFYSDRHYVPNDIVFTYFDTLDSGDGIRKKLDYIYIEYKGFFISGWSIKDNNEKKPVDIPGDFVETGTSVPKDVINLYPMWEKIEFKLIKKSYEYKWIHSMLIDGFYYYPFTRRLNHDITITNPANNMLNYGASGNKGIVKTIHDKINITRNDDGTSLNNAYNFFEGDTYIGTKNLKRLQEKYEKTSLEELTDVEIVEHTDTEYIIIHDVDVNSEINITNRSLCEILLVGGGGGGGGGNSVSSDCGGGGGGGAVIHVPGIILEEGIYTVTVGKGGMSTENGENTVMTSDDGAFKISASGGGAGGFTDSTNNYQHAKDGGSGGGSGSVNTSLGGNGKPDYSKIVDMIDNGNTDFSLDTNNKTLIDGGIVYKNKGGSVKTSDGVQQYAAGGGGAGYPANDVLQNIGHGGNGIKINVINTDYSGITFDNNNIWGGGGGGGNNTDSSANGGFGGGGNGGYIVGYDTAKKNGEDGRDLSGGGGGAGVNGGNGGKGGNGILILKIKKGYEIDHSDIRNFDTGLLLFQNNNVTITSVINGANTIKGSVVNWYGYFKPFNSNNLQFWFQFEDSIFELFIEEKRIPITKDNWVDITMESNIFYKIHMIFQTDNLSAKTLNAKFRYGDHTQEIGLLNTGEEDNYVLYHLKNFFDVTSMTQSYI